MNLALEALPVWLEQAGGASPPAVPTVLGISPSSGSTAGSTHVVIHVNASAGCISAAIDGVDLTGFGADDSTHVSGDTVAHGAGAVDVTVTNGVGTSAPLVGGYTYASSSFDPLIPPHAGAGHVRIWGTADHVTTAAGPIVTAAADQSGNGNNYTAPSGHEPTYNASDANCNSLPTFSFAPSSVQRLLFGDVGITTGPRTVIIVGSVTYGLASLIVSHLPASDELYGSTSQGTVLMNGNDGGVTVAGAAGVAEAPAFGVLVAVFDGTGAAQFYTSALTPSTDPAGALVDRTGGSGMLGNYSSATTTTFTQGGSTRHHLELDVALDATDAAYYLNGFGAECAIAIGP